MWQHLRNLLGLSCLHFFSQFLLGFLYHLYAIADSRNKVFILAGSTALIDFVFRIILFPLSAIYSSKMPSQHITLEEVPIWAYGANSLLWGCVIYLIFVSPRKILGDSQAATSIPKVVPPTKTPLIAHLIALSLLHFFATGAALLFEMGFLMENQTGGLSNFVLRILMFPVIPLIHREISFEQINYQLLLCNSLIWGIVLSIGITSLRDMREKSNP